MTRHVPWFLAALMMLAAPAGAASVCNDCHGMPPIDAPYRNITTGGFKGSHQTHQPTVAVASNCAVCHTGSGSYGMDHMNGKVDMSSNINTSPVAATYSKGVFFNQTSNPVMGTCSSVNCHFERTTPVWAGAQLAAPASCSTCHDLPPADGSHPALSGSGKKHGDYYGTGATSCIKCHVDHTVEAKPFAHASSAGNRGLILRFTAAPNTTGTYSKTANLAYPAYLPSQTTAANRNGTCTAMYCHSDGAGGAAKTTATWGGTLPADCTGCHGGNAISASPIATGIHPQHVNAVAFLGTNYGCASCHNGPVSAGNDRAIATPANHVNGTKTVSFVGGGTYDPTAKSCTATVCHATGKTGTTQPAAPSWTGAALGCNGCHGTSNPLGTPDYANGGAGAALANSHAKHVTVAADCDKCHTNTTTTGTAIKAGSTLHTNGAIDVTFDTALAGTGATWTASSKSCSNTSCHGTGVPVWGGTLPADCTGCHGDDAASVAPIATGKHPAHINNPAVLGTGNNFGCVDCHAKTVSGNRTISTAANHGNGFVDYSGVRAGGSARYSTTTKLCTNIYCHSNGNPSAIVYANAPAWNSTTVLGCNGCHGTTNAATGAPDYANGGAGTATANSHPKHVAGAGIADTRGCANCHSKTADAGVAGKLRNYSTLHLNGQPNVYFSTAIGGSYSTTAATCSATYCHGTAASPPWGSASLACSACHGATSALPGAHGIHYASTVLPSKFINYSGNVSSATVYRFTCSSCHAAGTSRATHAGGPANANGAAEVFYGYTAAGQKGSYLYGTTQGTDNGFKWTNGGAGCNATYCHGNGQGGSGLVAVSWSTTASSGTCIACHDTKQTGTTATKLSGKHDAHMNPTTNTSLGLGNGFNCIDCHAKTVSGNTTVSDKSKHVNKFVDYSGARAGGSARYSRTTKVCSTVYCHSNGNPGAIVYVTPAAWNSATTYGCNGCHGTTSTLGAPDYANGGAVPSTTANSHAKHVAGATDTTVCATCHVKTASMTTAGRFKDYTAISYHLNGQPNVYFSAAKAGATATWTPSSGTCSNVTCHGGTGSTVVWGAAVNCQDCHGGGAAASVADFGATFWNNGTISKFQMTGTGSWADTGHGRPTASGNYAGSGNPPANFAGIANYCEWCHDSTVGHNVSTNPFRLRNWTDATWGKNGVCMLCHATGSAGVTVGGQLRNSAANKVGADHYGAKHSTSLSGGQFCWDCHDPHGTGTTNQYMIRPKPALVSDATTGAPTSQSATSVVFTLSATPTGTDYAKSAAPFNGICNVCHTTTGHYTTTAGDSHNSGTRCTACHSHNGDGTSTTSAFTPVGGDCTTCHASQQGTGTRQVVGTDTVLASHHIVATTINQKSCQVCHEQTVFGHMVAGDVAVGMFNQDTGAALTYDGTTATASSLEASCNSCHDANGASRLGANALKPFTDSGDNTVPPFINWSTGKQAHGASMACFNCHGNSAGVAGNTLNPKYNAHGSATAKMLQYTYTATDTMTTATNFCYNCHGTTIAGGVTSPSIQAAVNLSASIGHKAERCSDCHDHHSAKPGNHTVGPNSALAPVLNGVPGRGGWPATSPTMATTWNGTGTLSVTYTAKLVATKEYEICFKCHAGSVLAPTGYTAGALRMSDLGLEFNPNNKSGHPVVASLNNYGGSVAPKALLAANMVAPWTAVGTQTMTCSDCHGATGTGAKGPHGSSVRWMLTGTNQAWPFTTTAGNGTASGTPWSLGNLTTGTAPNKLFCLNCHVVNASNGMHSALQSGQHSTWQTTARGACISCHIRIPHGAKTGRLLRTGAASVLGRYAPDGNGSEVGTSTQQVLGAYTKGTQTSNRIGTFTGVGCVEHAGGTDTW
ncbi:CxxxxCH/CxxCH domain c-type cytochrome [Geobacter pickeringii]|uniref:CxxxxCH/CxxCH domain c-type cytochrome n=1 Tax=Geobacter pickeringii TaxID=345632 RepID=UPI001F46B534|nr:CxxxxCH/CxxCH domain-containing protein [Geobacter pickeringii]